MNPLVAYAEAFSTKQTRHATVTESWSLSCKFTQTSPYRGFIATLPRLVTKAGAREADSFTSPTLRDRKLPAKLPDRAPSLGRAQQFPFIASLSIALSSSASASNFFSLAFSPSSSFSRFASSLFMPPY